MKRNPSETKLVSIASPSWEEPVKRLEGQGTEGAPQVKRRFTMARVELEAQEEVDFVVVNDRIEDIAQTLIVLMDL